MPRTILITGAAGFIGSHLTDRLLGKGDVVVGLDNFDDYYDPAFKRSNLRSARSNESFHLVEGDIRDESSLEDALATFGPDVIVHTAARPGVRPSLTDPMLYQDINVRGTLNVLNAARRGNVDCVLASSSSVYGESSTPPFSEDLPADRPRSPYAASKRAVEVFAHAYSGGYGLNVTCLRLFTVYGPRQRPDMAIYKFTEAILNAAPIELFGSTSARDYTYVDDVIDGICAAIDNPHGYQVFNLGTTELTPLSQLVECLATLLEREPEIRELPEQPGDVHLTLADISRAEVQLGYRPRVRIEMGLQSFVEWYLRERWHPEAESHDDRRSPDLTR